MNTLESKLTEAEIYVNFQNYKAANQVVQAVLNQYPTNRKALELSQRIQNESIDPPTNYHIGLLICAFGVACLIALFISRVDGWYWYLVSTLIIFAGALVIPDFVRFRVVPYMKGERKNLFQRISKE